MKLGMKVLIILTCMWALVFALIFFYSNHSLIHDYNILEKNRITDQINQTKKTLKSLMASVKVLSTDWSQWNDAYQFMIDKNNAFIESNLTLTTLANAKLNFIIFFSTSGKLFYGSYYASGAEKLSAVPESILASLQKDNAFSIVKTLKGKSGIIKIENAYLVVSAMPIMTSNSDGDPHGTLVMGYYIDTEQLAKLADIVNVNLSLFTLPLQSNSKLLNIALSSIKQGNDYVITPVDKKTIYGFSALKDVDNKIIGIIRIVSNRTIYNQGLLTIRNYLLIISVMGLLFLATTWLLLRVFVLKRIIQASNDVIEIKNTSEFSRRINVSGHDELASMIHTFNSFIEMIELTQEQLKHRIVVRTEELNRIAEVNKNLLDQVETQKQVEEKLRRQESTLRSLAYYDSVTGIPNRLYFEEMLDKLIKKSIKNDKSFWLFMVDADNFKRVNKEFGRDAGDTYLRHISEQLVKSIGEDGVVARFAGDEFMLFLPGDYTKEMIADKIKLLFDSLCEPVYLKNTQYVTTFSIGICQYPGDGTTIESLEKHADVSMYYAKRDNGNSFRFYEDVGVHRPIITT